VKLELRLDADRVAPGRELAGHVLVLEGGQSRSLTLTVRLCERSPGYLEIPFSHTLVLSEGDLATGQAIDFRCELPEGAPPSVKGKHGELFWELEAASDAPGLDARVSQTFQVTAQPG
jgi:hypothetical protein